MKHHDSLEHRGYMTHEVGIYQVIHTITVPIEANSGRNSNNDGSI